MQYNIYFRKDNWQKFKDEENKSNLINELLDKHYGQYPLAGEEYPKVQTKLEEPIYVDDSKDQGTPKSGLENMSDNFTGPIYRNKKKGKL